MKRPWEYVIVAVCVVVVAVAFTVAPRDCYEVCAELGMKPVDMEHGCAVACLCRPEQKRYDVEFDVTEAWGTRMAGVVHLGFGVRMSVLVVLPYVEAPDPQEDPDAWRETTAFIRNHTIGKMVFIGASDGARDESGHWVEDVRIDTYDRDFTSLRDYMIEKGYARDTWNTSEP
jgi:hypothetical protein